MIFFLFCLNLKVLLLEDVVRNQCSRETKFRSSFPVSRGPMARTLFTPTIGTLAKRILWKFIIDIIRIIHFFRMVLALRFWRIFSSPICYFLCNNEFSRIVVWNNFFQAKTSSISICYHVRSRKSRISLYCNYCKLLLVDILYILIIQKLFYLEKQILSGTIYI